MKKATQSTHIAMPIAIHTHTCNCHCSFALLVHSSQWSLRASNMPATWHRSFDQNCDSHLAGSRMDIIQCRRRPIVQAAFFSASCIGMACTVFVRRQRDVLACSTTMRTSCGGWRPLQAGSRQAYDGDQFMFLSCFNYGSDAEAA
jgi:hypothetical protein